MQIKRHVCPCNCYSSCCIVSHIENDKVQGIAGDPLHQYTRGDLCSKGLGFLDTFYHKDRILYPMRQVPRGSGNWQIISWDDALYYIAEKILQIKDTYGSLVPLCVIKGSGNIGMLHSVWKWFARSLEGGITTGTETICWNALVDAYKVMLGDFPPPAPELMADSKLIVLWGVNPAWTAIHQMHYIRQAHLSGAKIIVIDPILTVTASKADYYFQIIPGSDEALALAMAHYLIATHNINTEFLEEQVEDWQEFYQYVRGLNPLELAAKTGIAYEVIQEIVNLYAPIPSAVIWIGLGMQRYSRGGSAVRAILAITALTGHLCHEKIYFSNPYFAKFFTTEWDWMQPTDQMRRLSMYRLGQDLLDAREPNIKMAIIAAANPLEQLAETEKIGKALATIDTVVVAGFFLNETAQWADIFLPSTTWLEHWDVVPSYWHNWLGINEPAVLPRGQCLSDINMITKLTSCLNQLKPGTSTFPILTEEEWLDKIFSAEMYQLLNIKNYRELLQGPRQYKASAKNSNGKLFSTPSGKVALISHGDDTINTSQRMEDTKNDEFFPYRLLTPHTSNMLNSQFGNVEDGDSPCIYIHSEIANKKGLRTGQFARIYNELAEKQVKIIVNDGIVPGVVVYYKQDSQSKSINSLIRAIPTDYGEQFCQGKGLAVNETFVDVVPLRNV